MSKIVYIVNSLNMGGTEQLVVQMSQAFSNEFDISVICLDEPGIWAPRLREKGIPVHSFWRQPGIDPSMAFRLAGYAKKNRVELIHAHQCTPWFYGALSRLFYRRPRLLFEEHGRFYPEIENKKRILFNSLLIQKLTHRVVAVSGDVKNRLVKYEGVSKDRIQVVYNGVKPSAKITEEERLALRKEFGLADNDFVIGTVGRFDPIKNLPLFVNAFGKARLRQPALKALIVGDGPCFNDIRELIKTNNLEEAIILTGYRADAIKLIQCMDLFILSSLSEGTSMALLEAMSSGIPALVTGVGGNPEIVVNNDTGWIVPSNNIDSMASAILDAYEQEEKRKKLGDASRLRFEEDFTFERMIDNYRRIYREMLCME